jgi:hypothetical protein
MRKLPDQCAKLTTDRFGLKPERLAADTAHGSAEMLNWLAEEQRIAPHVPVIDKSAGNDGTFARAEFRYDKDADAYVCPGGKFLTTTGTLVNDAALPRQHARLCPMPAQSPLLP